MGNTETTEASRSRTQLRPSATSLAKAHSTLVECGFDPDAARHLVRLGLALPSGAVESRSRTEADGLSTRQSLAERAEAAVVMSRWCEAELLSTARAMTVEAGAALLPDLGVASVAELSPSQAQRWRACSKSAVASELNALAGWGIQSCHDRVGLALAPGSIAERVDGALRGGWNDSRAVLGFWRKVRALSVESASRVADEVFGPGVDGDGQPVRTSRAEFTQSLSRSIVAAEGSAATVRKRRHDRLAERDAAAVIDDDGVGVLTVGGGAASVAAAALRVDTIARKARAAGDPRTISQIRSDLTLALIVHGALPDRGASPDQPVAGGVGIGDDGLAEAGELVRAALGRHAAPIALEVAVPLDSLIGDGSTAYVPGVGEIAAEHARELALTPGATIHRLLTDPADGRCVERSTASYVPDAEMLAQIRAVDRTCRGPGCVRDARHCQPDHEHPHADGGLTSETNLVLKHSFHHNNKTLNIWQSELHPDRRVTWTTLFGQKYVTRPFDYRALAPSRSSTPAEVSIAPGGRQGPGVVGAGGCETLLTDHDVYYALAEQWRVGSITPMSDLADDADTAELISLRHHTPGGAIRLGPSGLVSELRSGNVSSKPCRANTAAGAVAPTMADDPPPF
ncbi:HNH endonuclease [Ornithinimicrobium sp. Arc0846-15]|nr:HNH endonuclease [Ornithinimicrobium laminariae]